jgi:hypothetical protein
VKDPKQMGGKYSDGSYRDMVGLCELGYLTTSRQGPVAGS